MMKHFFVFLLMLLHITTLVAQPTNLRCEHLYNPLDIDTYRPRLTWMLDNNSFGAKQLAFRIVLGTDSLAIIDGEG